MLNYRKPRIITYGVTCRHNNPDAEYVLSKTTDTVWNIKLKVKNSVAIIFSIDFFFNKSRAVINNHGEIKIKGSKVFKELIETGIFFKILRRGAIPFSIREITVKKDIGRFFELTFYKSVCWNKKIRTIMYCDGQNIDFGDTKKDAERNLIERVLM